jgi:hypothetical protein
MHGLRLFPSLFALSLALFAPAPAAHAAQSYDNCTGFIRTLPAAIRTPGVWCLAENLNTAMVSGVAIDIQANHVTLDCNDFRISGMAAGEATTAIGIRARERLNATVRHCNVRGFYTGVALSGGGHVLEDSRIDTSTLMGVDAAGDGTVVQRTRVTDTGGSSVKMGIAIGIRAIGAVDLLDNTVAGVAPSEDMGGKAVAYGIRTHSLTGTVAGNRVRGLAAYGPGSARGISNHDNGRVMLRDNDLTGNGTGLGISCSDAMGAAMDNMVAGFATALTGCTAERNLLLP